jgi:hypothetical protein
VAGVDWIKIFRQSNEFYYLSGLETPHAGRPRLDIGLLFGVDHQPVGAAMGHGVEGERCRGSRIHHRNRMCEEVGTDHLPLAILTRVALEAQRPGAVALHQFPSATGRVSAERW